MVSITRNERTGKKQQNLGTLKLNTASLVRRNFVLVGGAELERLSMFIEGSDVSS